MQVKRFFTYIIHREHFDINSGIKFDLNQDPEPDSYRHAKAIFLAVGYSKLNKRYVTLKDRHIDKELFILK